MDDCDVLIVGGGPAGSTCAWKLHRAGFHVIVMDKAAFPRDKPCAGWITPQAVQALRLDLGEYTRGRTLQVITGFRVRVMGSPRSVEVKYDRPVSFGIRRCEFDHYLLQRSQATLRLGSPVETIRRDRGRWIVNEAIRASTLVGAGGHWCPVARMLNGARVRGPLVAAQEAEFPIESHRSATFTTEAGTPEFYFCRDFKGYGWCFRKQQYLNVGLGRIDRHGPSKAAAEFLSYLKADGRMPADTHCQWRGHAYLVEAPRTRRAVDEDVLLVGDAAGLADSRSGEGIRAGIESGLLAASMIAGSERLLDYETRLRQCGVIESSSGSTILPDQVSAKLGGLLLQLPWFVRHVVLDRWFLKKSVQARSC